MSTTDMREAFQKKIQSFFGTNEERFSGFETTAGRWRFYDAEVEQQWQGWQLALTSQQAAEPCNEIVGADQDITMSWLVKLPMPVGTKLYAAPLPQATVQQIKDHLIAQAVNVLRDIAIQFHATQQLRDRIARIASPLAKGDAADLEREIAAAKLVPVVEPVPHSAPLINGGSKAVPQEATQDERALFGQFWNPLRMANGALTEAHKKCAELAWQARAAIHQPLEAEMRKKALEEAHDAIPKAISELLAKQDKEGYPTASQCAAAAQKAIRALSPQADDQNGATHG